MTRARVDRRGGLVVEFEALPQERVRVIRNGNHVFPAVIAGEQMKLVRKSELCDLFIEDFIAIPNLAGSLGKPEESSLGYSPNTINYHPLLSATGISQLGSCHRNVRYRHKGTVRLGRSNQTDLPHRICTPLRRYQQKRCSCRNRSNP